MNIKQILNEIKQLAMSQGFYGRLFSNLMQIKEYEPERWGEIVDTLEGQHFADPVDMVLFFEC